MAHFNPACQFGGRRSNGFVDMKPAMKNPPGLFRWPCSPKNILEHPSGVLITFTAYQTVGTPFIVIGFPGVYQQFASFQPLGYESQVRTCIAHHLQSLPIQNKCWSPRRNICPRLMAGEAKHFSPISFRATSSNCGPTLTTFITPLSLRK